MFKIGTCFELIVGISVEMSPDIQSIGPICFGGGSSDRSESQIERLPGGGIFKNSSHFDLLRRNDS